MFLKKMLPCFLLLSALIACQSGSGERNAAREVAVPFKEAKNYFVRNDFVPSSLENPKIETQEALESIFEMATTMGPDGKPTPVDFETQYALAVVGEKTNKSETFIPVSLVKTGDSGVILSYRVDTGEEQSYSIVPFLLLVVDKADAPGAVTLHRQE